MLDSSPADGPRRNTVGIFMPLQEQGTSYSLPAPLLSGSLWPVASQPESALHEAALQSSSSRTRLLPVRAVSQPDSALLEAAVAYEAEADAIAAAAAAELST